MQKHSWCVTLLIAGVLVCGLVDAQQGPDVIVSAMPGIAKNGTVGGITAYSLASTSCNHGDMVADWFANSNNHPVIAGNIYRIKDGLVEQLGVEPELAPDQSGYAMPGAI